MGLYTSLKPVDEEKREINLNISKQRQTFFAHEGNACEKQEYRILDLKQNYLTTELQTLVYENIKSTTCHHCVVFAPTN